MEEFIGGVLKDTPDSRDYKISDYLVSEEAALPIKLDYEGLMGPVLNQGSFPMCAAFSGAGIKMYQELKDLGWMPLFSPMFIYWQKSNAGNGMYSRDVVDILTKKGCCREEYLPMSTIAKEGIIPQNAFEDALMFATKSYARVQGVVELKKTLYEFGPCYISVPLYESFSRVAKDGVVPMPVEGETVRGGHAMIVCGYDDNEKLVKVKNSWGASWGDSGYCYLPYDYVDKLAWDMYQLIDADSPDIDPPVVPDPKKKYKRIFYFIVVAIALALLLFYIERIF